MKDVLVGIVESRADEGIFPVLDGGTKGKRCGLLAWGHCCNAAVCHGHGQRPRFVATRLAGVYVA